MFEVLCRRFYVRGYCWRCLCGCGWSPTGIDYHYRAYRPEVKSNKVIDSSNNNNTSMMVMTKIDEVEENEEDEDVEDENEDDDKKDGEDNEMKIVMMMNQITCSSGCARIGSGGVC